jgi:hypothetical protein
VPIGLKVTIIIHALLRNIGLIYSYYRDRGDRFPLDTIIATILLKDPIQVIKEVSKDAPEV